MVSEFHYRRRVEFADTDLAGIMHFARFFVFMETAEHEFLRSFGTSVSTTFEDNKIGWPRLTASAEYIRPLKFEDVVDIYLFVDRKGQKSLSYKFVFEHDGELVARGEMASACCICNPGEAIRAITIPPELAEQIEEYRAE